MSTRAALSSARELFLLSSEALEVQSKCQLLEEASRLYIEAADLVDDGNAKRAITYLSNNCLFQAHILKHTGPVVDIKMDDANEGLVSLYSNRLLLLSHKNREMRLKDVPKSIESSPEDKRHDSMEYEKALQDRGLTHVNNSTKQSGRTYSNLGESFMMLDPNKSIILSSSSSGDGSGGNTAHVSGRSVGAYDNKIIRSYAKSSDVNPRKSIDNNNNNSSSSSGGVVVRHDYLNGHKENMRSVANNDHHQSSCSSAHRDGSSSDDDPLLASSHMLTSYLQVSSIDAVESNQDSISISSSGPSVVGNNTTGMEGILNLLQTVKRLDEENTRLVRRVEEMGQMERTREQMVRDAELMHAKYSLKISQLSDYMRTHYNVLIPHELIDMTDDTIVRAAPSTTRAEANGHDYRLRVNDSCQRMDSNAAANYADDSNDRSSHHQQPQQQLYKPSMVACNNANTPPIPSNRTVMTESPSPHTASSPRPPPHLSGATTGESLATRQQQLERMVANLISRLEEAHSDIKKKDQLLHQYVTIINTRRDESRNGSRLVEVRAVDSVNGSSDDVDGSRDDLTSRQSTARIQGDNNNASYNGGNDGHDRMQPINQHHRSLHRTTTVDSSVITKSSSSSNPVHTTSASIHRNHMTSASVSAHHSISSPIIHHSNTNVPNQIQHHITSAGHEPSKRHGINIGSALPRNKHHSTSTLEVLQRSAHSKSTGK